MVSHDSMQRARDAALSAWARFVAHRPKTTIAIVLLVALASGALAAARLGFRSDRSDLIDPSLSWQRRYAEFRAAFPRWDDAVVVIDTKTAPDGAALEAYLNALQARLDADPRIARADLGFPTDAAPAGLILTLPPEKLRPITEDLQRAGPVIASPSLGHLLSLSTLGQRMGGLDARSEADLAALLDRAARLGAGGPDTPAALLGEIPPIQRLVTPSGTFNLALVALADDGAGAKGVQTGKAAAILALREHLGALRAEARFGAIEAGVTGVPVLEADETALSTSDSSRASAIAAALIALLAIVVYRGVVVPALLMGGLGLGLAASFGWATVSVGHLQVLSVVFMVMLVGLGADMTMHLIARLEVTHPDHAHIERAILDSFRAVGPGVITGTITTAAAFAATAFTAFKGSAELGVIAAGGVVLCTLVSLAFFPAALALLPRPERSLRGHDGGVSRPFLGGAVNFIDRRAPITVGVWALLLAACVPLAMRVRYDTDLLKMLPDSAESVRWERRLAADDEQSSWHAVVVAKTADEARTLTERLRALPEVADVSGAGILFPDRLAEKEALLATVPEPPMPLFETEALDLAASARQIATLAKPESSVGATAARVAALSPEAVARVNAAYGAERAALASRIGAIKGAKPATPESLPPAIRAQVVGSNGELMLRVFPTRAPDGVTSVLAPERLGPFMRAVTAVAPGVSGPTSQIYESARVIKRANVLGGVYAALAILGVLFFDFRRVGDVLSALLPVGVAVLATLAALGLFGIDLNFANTIVAPLIVGLGVTAGVNAVHRWRQQPHDPPAGLAGGAGRAITLTILSTAIGFACMMTAQHRGIRSLGLVMTIGLGMVWAATVFLLPAVLRLRTKPIYDPPVAPGVPPRRASREGARRETGAAAGGTPSR